jgi:hypothetical protein
MDLGPWLTDQIEAHAADRETDPMAAHRLAEAYAALAGAKAPAFGMELPAEVPDREALRARALELLKGWLAKLDGVEKDKIRAQLAGYGIGSGPPVVHTEPPPPSEPE